MENVAGDSRSARTWTVALTSLAFFLVQISLLVVVTALPAIRHDLRASLSTLGWVLNAYGLAFGAGVITAAAIGDRLGRVKVFTAGLAVFTVASANGGLAQDTTVLIASRTLQWLAAAAARPATERRPRPARCPAAGEMAASTDSTLRGGLESRQGDYSLREAFTASFNRCSVRHRRPDRVNSPLSGYEKEVPHDRPRQQRPHLCAAAPARGAALAF